MRIASKPIFQYKLHVGQPTRQNRLAFKSLNEILTGVHRILLEAHHEDDLDVTGECDVYANYLACKFFEAMEIPDEAQIYLFEGKAIDPDAWIIRGFSNHLLTGFGLNDDLTIIVDATIAQSKKAEFNGIWGLIFILNLPFSQIPAYLSDFYGKSRWTPELWQEFNLQIW